jgi:hypothetical protein
MLEVSAEFVATRSKVTYSVHFQVSARGVKVVCLVVECS